MSRLVSVSMFAMILTGRAAAQIPPPPPPPTVVQPGIGISGSGSTGASISFESNRWFDTRLGTGMRPGQSPRSGDGSVQGAVVNAVTGAPVRRATVMVNGPGVNKSVATGADGRFRIDQLPDGRFFLTAHREGFAGFNPGPVSVVLAKSENKDGVVLKVQPGAVVTGRVVDEEGEPVIGVQVSILRRDFQRGKARFLPGNSGVTDDRGEYRIHSIPPGRYRLAAMGHLRGAAFGPGAPALSYGVMYHPNSREPEGAQAIRLTSGQEMKADFRLEPAPTAVIRGRVLGVDNFRGVSISAWPAEGEGLHLAGPSTEFNHGDGTFTLRNMPAGRYAVRAIVFEKEARLVGSQTVDTRGGAVDNVVISLSAGVELSGKLRVEGGTLPVGARVMLTPGGFGGYAGPPPQPVEVDADGTFRFATVLPGIWNVHVMPPMAPNYIKSMKLGDADVLRKDMEIGNTAPGTLEIVLSAKGATIDGSLTGAEEGAGTVVMALPEGEERFLQGFQVVRGAMAGGRFRLSGLRPASYRLLAVAAPDMERVRDPELVKEIESSLPLVKVEEEGRVTQDVKLTTSADLDKAERALR